MSEDNRLAAAAAPNPSTAEATLVRRLDGRALFFEQAPLEASRSNLHKSADLFRESARAIECVNAAARNLMLYADECALILKQNGYPAKAQSLEARGAQVATVLAAGSVAGEKAGIAQASESLARISSSHPEDGGIREALEKLYRAYVSLLDLGRRRIVALGGTCDAVDVMEKGDPALVAARAALNPAPLPIGEEREKN